MTRTALLPARPTQALRRGGVSAALAVVLALGAASPTAADEPGAAPEIEYRFPFDPDTTTPKGGEFASKIANGKKRKHPHRGHDFSFGGARGADIPAVADGIVANKSSKGSLGNCVALQHADGAFSAYCHMEKPTPLELGQWVNMGDPVGKVGGTGKPKVPVHLHMTMGWSVDAMKGIGTFDPIPYIEARLAKPEPERKPEPEKASKRPAPAEGIAVTHSFAAAV
jgi:murein DD-endopeptidase MepM/ murein hydrolase activator NlpD